MFPVWLGFRGGKGVATALGVLIALAWPVAPSPPRSGSLCWRFSAIPRSAALIASVAGGGHRRRSSSTGATALLIAAIALLVILRHHANIRRLIGGTESRVRSGKS